MGKNGKNMLIRVAPRTRERLERIAAIRRWKLGVVVDECVNHYLASQVQPSRKSRAAEPAPA